MTQQEFVKFLSQRKWDEDKAARLYRTALIDKTLPLSQWRTTLVGAFCSNNNNVSVLKHLADALGTPIPQWKDITKPNLSFLKEHLLANVAANSARTYLRQLAAVMGLYEDDMPKGFRSALSIKKEPSQHVALTEEEVERIHRYIPRNSIEADIKRAFMLECLCGARSCDISSLTTSNVKDGWLVYVSQKTKTETSVPVHRNLIDYLTMPVRCKNYCRSTVNRTLKAICRKCGINEVVKLFTKGQWITAPKYELVGSHTARRSFATQLAQRGVPVPTISKLMGHSNVEMTSQYICIEDKNIGNEAMDFFN